MDQAGSNDIEAVANVSPSQHSVSATAAAPSDFGSATDPAAAEDAAATSTMDVALVTLRDACLAMPQAAGPPLPSDTPYWWNTLSEVLLQEDRGLIAGISGAAMTTSSLAAASASSSTVNTAAGGGVSLADTPPAAAAAAAAAADSVAAAAAAAAATSAAARATVARAIEARAFHRGGGTAPPSGRGLTTSTKLADDQIFSVLTGLICADAMLVRGGLGVSGSNGGGGDSNNPNAAAAVNNHGAPSGTAGWPGSSTSPNMGCGSGAGVGAGEGGKGGAGAGPAPLPPQQLQQQQQQHQQLQQQAQQKLCSVMALPDMKLLLPALPRRVCQYAFRKNDIVWICKVCQADETCVLCNDCFRSSDHKGHEVYFYHAQVSVSTRSRCACVGGWVCRVVLGVGGWVSCACCVYHV